MDTGLNEYLVAKFNLDITFVIFILLLGITGNSTIICVYYKKKTNMSKNILILSLAMIDTTFCCFVPTLVFIDAQSRENIGRTANSLLFSFILIIIRFALFSSIRIICIMSIDRLWAVWKFHKYAILRRKLDFVVGSVIIATLTEVMLITFSHWDIVIIVDILVHVILTFLLLLVTYPTIIFCVYKAHNKRFQTVNCISTQHSGVPSR